MHALSRDEFRERGLCPGSEYAPAENSRATRKVICGVDIGERSHPRNGAAAQIGERVRQRMGPRPPHRRKSAGHARAPSQSDQPVAAIRGRAEHGIMPPKQAKGLANMGGAYAGHVGAYDHDRAARRAVHDALHALAQVAMALRGTCDIARPYAPGCAAIGRDGDRRVPRGMVRDTRQHRRSGMARKARGRGDT